jgi:hypothetical protein
MLRFLLAIGAASLFVACGAPATVTSATKRDQGTYLVCAGSPIGSIDEIDRPGVRVAAIDNTTTAEARHDSSGLRRSSPSAAWTRCRRRSVPARWTPWP